MDKRVVFAAIVIIAVLYLTMQREKFTEIPYRYGLVDTNPARRVSNFFDACSPENMEDCPRNNPYEGLPLP